MDGASRYEIATIGFKDYWGLLGSRSCPAEHLGRRHLDRDITTDGRRDVKTMTDRPWNIKTTAKDEELNVVSDRTSKFLIMDSLISSFNHATTLLPRIVSENPRSITIALTSLAVARVIHLVATDYSRWKSLGPGGLPYNSYGYLKQSLLRPLAFSDLYSTLPYQPLKKLSRLESQRFLPALPVRQGPRPLVPAYAGPSRQVTHAAPRALVEASTAILKEVANANSKITTYGDSLMERGGPALFVREEVFRSAPEHLHVSAVAGPTTETEREFFHLHESEGSCHCFLSAADAAELLEKGWGQRHPLSGRFIGKNGLSAGYVTVYAPLEEKSLDIVRLTAKAALAYAADGKVKVL